jgi:transglutaminase-like putative cysteine protease
MDIESHDPATESRRLFEIHDRTTFALSNGGHLAELWYPVIPDTPHQRVLDLQVLADFEWELSHDSENGNALLHSVLPVGDASLEIHLSYLVERAPSRTRFESWAGGLEIPRASSGFARWLRSETHIEVTSTTKQLAVSLVADASETVDKARRIFDHVTATMVYDAAHQSHCGSSEHALLCSAGNCGDINALFISLARSVGIPARLVLGQALQPELDMCGYHCWAEFFANGLGWVPVDASCACRYGGADYFGRLDANHVAWSVGRDVLLAPPQRGPRLMFLAGPYLELDGTPQTSLVRTVSLVPSAPQHVICEPNAPC